MMKATDDALTALRELYNTACHHPRCERSWRDGTPRTCSCGVSAALERARIVLGLRDFTEEETDGH
jgi:hypothetical protein